MPRSRVLRPDFWDSPDTAAASLRCRLLFLAMKNWADDYGIGDATPIRVIGFAFPHDDIPPVEYQPLLDEVNAAYGVVFFRHEQRPYYVIPGWSADQPRERKARPRSAELMQAATAAVAEARAAVLALGVDRPSDDTDFPGHEHGSSGTNHEPPGEGG